MTKNWSQINTCVLGARCCIMMIMMLVGNDHDLVCACVCVSACASCVPSRVCVRVCVCVAITTTESTCLHSIFAPCRYIVLSLSMCTAWPWRHGAPVCCCCSLYHFGGSFSLHPAGRKKDRERKRPLEITFVFLFYFSEFPCLQAGRHQDDGEMHSQAGYSLLFSFASQQLLTRCL